MQSFCDTDAAVSNVVIVEDSPNMQVALQDLVESLGKFRVVAVETTAATAIHWAASHPAGWDIAIIDLMLEQGDGFEIIRRFASEPKRGHVIVFSGYVTDVIRRHCKALGADAVFHKLHTTQLAEYMELVPSVRR